MTTIHDDLDAAIPEAPTLLSVDEALHAGRAALRRRRQGAAAGLATVVAVAVVAVTSLTGGTTGSAQRIEPADQTTDVDPTPGSWLTPGTVADFAGREGDLVVWQDDGALLLRPGTRVVREWENPMQLLPPGRSLALVVEHAGETHWILAVEDRGVSDDWDGGGTFATISVEPSQAHGLPFERWVNDEMTRQSVGWPNPDYVRLRANGTLTPVGDAEILAQTEDAPRLVPPQADSVVVALVKTGQAQLCVAAAQARGRQPEYLYLAASTYGPDLAGCVASMPRWEIRG